MINGLIGFINFTAFLYQSNARFIIIYKSIKLCWNFCNKRHYNKYIYCI